MTKIMTMGEVTKKIQGYPTQLWLPNDNRRDRSERAALVHDRRHENEQRGIYMIPGNSFSKLILPGSEVYTTLFGAGEETVIKRLRVPNAILWSNHGGPCERRGAKYGRIPDGIMTAVYNALSLSEKPVILPGAEIGRNADFTGPFDWELPTDSSPELKLRLMDRKLLSDDY